MESNNPFKQIEDEYFILRGQVETGRITRAQFEAALHDLMIQDTQGRHWTLGVDSGKWFYHDGQTWVEGNPYAPGIQGKRVAPSQPTTMTASPVPVSTRDEARTMTQPAPVIESQPKRGLGCVQIGCITILGIILVIVALGATLYFRLPQQLGLVPSAQRMYADTPDREAATALRDELNKAGIDTKGMGIYVLPYRDKPGSIAYIVLDSSQGFNFKSGSKDPLIDYFKQLAQSDTSKKYGLNRVAIEYKDPTGESLVSLTASTDSIRAFINGTLPRSEFLKKIDGKANWVGFYQQVLK